MRHDADAVSGHLNSGASTSSVHLESAFPFADSGSRQAQNPLQDRHFPSSTRRPIDPILKSLG
jgi:hypothetical protein